MINIISKFIAILIVVGLKVIIYPIYGIAMLTEGIAKFIRETCKYMIDKLNDNNQYSISQQDSVVEIVEDKVTL